MFYWLAIGESWERQLYVSPVYLYKNRGHRVRLDEDRF